MTMDLANRGFRMLLLLWVCGVCIATQAIGAEKPGFLLWDGEQSFDGANASLNGVAEFRGKWCMEGLPTPWNKPTVKLTGLPSYRADLSGYDAICFFAKADQLGKTFAFSVYGWPNTSNEVNIDAHITGGALTTDYRFVYMPVALLKTAEFPLNKVESFIFGKAQPDAGHKIYIDEIWAVYDQGLHPNAAPLAGPVPATEFGDVQVYAELRKTVKIPNVGAAPLVISDIELSGENADEFHVLATLPMTIPAGQSGDITVMLAPTVQGAKSALMSLAHSDTIIGNQTGVVLNGTGRAPAIEFSATKLDFGTAPLGKTVSWDLTVRNVGNQPLEVMASIAEETPFKASPASLLVAEGASGKITVTFTPTAQGQATADISFATNDPSKAATGVHLTGVGGEVGALVLATVGEVTSSTAGFAWPVFSGADEVRLYVGAEPPTAVNGPLPDQKLVATLPANATEYTIANLAPSVDAFVRVEALSAGQVIASGNSHVRTVGGPRADLATPVREVHAYAPDVLMIVVENKNVHSFTLANNFYDGGVDEVLRYNGPEWQAGPWTVTRGDGTALGVTAVYRHSVPVGQPYYEVGFKSKINAHLVDVDHRIYLKLTEPVGNREVLTITGPFDTEFILPFSDKYLETPVIQLNQVGYSPRASKRWAYVSGWMGDGGPLALGNFPANAEVFAEPEDPFASRAAVTGALAVSQRSAMDSDSGSEVKQIDLSSVPAAEGTFYRVRIPGVGISWPTQVSETAVFKAFYVVTRGLYLNRWGRDLREDCTEWGPRPPDHPVVYFNEPDPPKSDGFYPSTTPTNVEMPLTGGHHDAGDFDIRVFHDEISMLLMRAYEMQPSVFTDGQLTIPEKDNGIPDILDEASWNLRAWEQLQDEDGGIRPGAESYAHPQGIHYADEDPLPYWTHSKDKYHTMRCAGLFAQLARLIAPFDQDRANELRMHAFKAYEYAKANGIGATTSGPTFLGSGELFRLSTEGIFGLDDPSPLKEMFVASWDATNVWGKGAFDKFRALLYYKTAYFADPQPVLGDHLLGYLCSGDAVASHMSIAQERLTLYVGQALQDLENAHAHRSARPAAASPDWGEGTAVGEYVMRVMAYLQFKYVNPCDISADYPDYQKYFDALSLSADYVLGANPLGLVWFTGLGSRHALEPFHMDTLTFIHDGYGPMPGIPVFGPVAALPASPSDYDIGARLFYPAFQDHPLMRRYADIRTFISCNETASKLNARNAELLAALLAPGMAPPESWLPGGKEHANTLPPREGIVPATVDVTPPEDGTAESPAKAGAGVIVVDYAGAQDEGSGLKEVRLWVKKGEAGVWRNTLMRQIGAYGSFNYTGMTGDDTYYFATQAVDVAGNMSRPPEANGDTFSVYSAAAPPAEDTTPPQTGTLTSPVFASTAPIVVTYEGAADNDGGTGLSELRLWVRKGTSGAWVDSGLTSATGSGAFEYAGVTGSGEYFFYLVAKDNAGNVSPAPAESPMGSTIFDIDPPTPGALNVPAVASKSPVAITYGGAGDPESGLKRVYLWVRTASADWGIAGVSSTAASGTLNYPATGDGTYYFALQAEDNAGNFSAAPSGTGSGCLYDSRSPVLDSVSSPPYARATPIEISYSGADDGDGSGFKQVHLWLRKGSGEWADTGLRLSTPSGMFQSGPGVEDTYYYAVRTEDKAGNLAPVPVAEGHTTTVYDRTPPVMGAVSAPATADAPPIAVTYAGVSDSPSGIKAVYLWAKKGAGAWTQTGDVATGESGSFSYKGMTGDDTYYFAIQIEDKAGNITPVPSGDGVASTAYDTEFSAGTASSPEYAKAAPITVTYSGAADTVGGGIKAVYLWCKKGDAGAWTKTALSQTGAAGSFSFTEVGGDAVYYFATQAENNAGSLTPEPFGSGDTATKYDTTAPDPGKITSPEYTRQIPIVIAYTGADDAVAGLKEVRLWVKKGYAGAWEDTTMRSTTPDGSFSLSNVAADDVYFFFLQAEDNAGHTSPEPTDALVFGE